MTALLLVVLATGFLSASALARPMANGVAKPIAARRHAAELEACASRRTRRARKACRRRLAAEWKRRAKRHKRKHERTDTTTTVAAGTTAAGGTAASGTTTAPTPSPPPPPDSTWQSETAFPVPAFTPLRTIDVYSQAAFTTAWANLQAGDEIDVHGVTFTGEVVLANKQLPAWAEVHFDSATRFVGYASAQNLPAVWIDKDSFVRFYGGDVSDSASDGQAGDGIIIYDSSHVSWWGFDVHDVGGSGIFATGIDAPSSYLDLKGEVSHWGENLAWDPHAEKGTGMHGILVADSNYGVADSRFAIYAHDGATGAGMEIGGSKATDGAWGNTIYMWCQNLTMQATSQVAGNCIQVWGDNVTGNDVAYLEAENIQGRGWDATGLYSGQTLATDTVDYGRVSDTNLNPYLAKTEPSLPASAPWDDRHGTVFVDVLPTP